MRSVLLTALLAAGALAVSGQTTDPAARWPTEGPPRPLAARSIKFPPYELRTLPNGLQVVAVLHHEQPVVNMRLLIRAGSALDPRDKLGLADLSASLLDQGTTTQSATALNDDIDFIGGELGAGAGTDLSFASVRVMKDSFERGLRMLSDVVRHPAFDPAEIERQRQQSLSSLQVSFDNPEFIANAVFDRLVYGFHPYGLPGSGTPETLAAIARSDIVAYHDKHFLPNNSLLAVVGDVTADEAFDMVQRVFGDWQRHDVRKETFIAPPEPVRRVIVVNKPDSVQTEIRVGQLGVKRNTSDYMALDLALRILGGEGANRLHQVLRTERSLTYGAEANFDTLKESGDFEATTNTRSSATGEVLRLMVDEFWRLQREPVNERELSDAKAYVTGNFPLTIETPDAIATQVLNELFYGLPVQELETYRDRVNAISPEDIQRVARYYLNPGRLSVVLVGDASAFTSQLHGAGFDNYEVVNMDDLDLTSPNFKKPGAAASNRRGAAFTPSRRAIAAYTRRSAQQSPVGEASPSAESLLDKVIAAKGGLTRLRAVKTITAVTRADTATPNGRINVETTTFLEYPNRVHVETKLPGETIVQVYDGARAWVRDAHGTHDVPTRMAQEMETSFKRDLLGVLIAARDGSVRTRLLPDVQDEAGRIYHALEFSSVGLEPTVIDVDPETNLIVKQRYVAGGNQPLVEELFTDYKAIDGVQIAFTATVRQGGQAVAERHVSDIKINAPLDPALFKRPTS